jgi:hypothetical protein
MYKTRHSPCAACEHSGAECPSRPKPMTFFHWPLAHNLVGVDRLAIPVQPVVVAVL